MRGPRSTCLSGCMGIIVMDDVPSRVYTAAADQQHRKGYDRDYCSSDRLDLAFASVHQTTLK